MTTKRITVIAKPREKFTVDLVGVEYLITAPKSTIAITLAEKAKAIGDDPSAFMAEIETWVTAAFGGKQTPKIMKRLTDPADDLDIAELMDLMQQLAEAGTANPSS